MLRSFLILSMDQSLLDTRVMVLRSRGFTTLSATSIDDALKLAKSAQPSVGIVCHTLSELEKSMFVNALIRVCPRIFIMQLRKGKVDPHRLVADCERIAPMDAAGYAGVDASGHFSSSSDDEQPLDSTTVQ